MSAVHTIYNEMSHALLVEEALRLRARVAELEAELAAARSDLEWARNPGQNGF